MQESTVTIEEVEEDEVVDLIGMFNSYAKKFKFTHGERSEKETMPS